LAASKSKSTT